MFIKTLDDKAFAGQLAKVEGFELKCCETMIKQVKAELYRLGKAETVGELIDAMLSNLKEFDALELTTRTKGQSESFKATFDLTESESNARPLGMRSCSRSDTHIFSTADSIHVPSILIYCVFVEKTFCNVGADDYVLSSPSATGITIHLPSDGAGHLLMVLLRGVEVQETQSVVPTSVQYSQQHTNSFGFTSRKEQSSGRRQFSTTTRGRKRGQYELKLAGGLILLADNIEQLDLFIRTYNIKLQ